MNAAHAQAEAIRNTARSANEVGTGDGNTVKTVSATATNRVSGSTPTALPKAAEAIQDIYWKYGVAALPKSNGNFTLTLTNSVAQTPALTFYLDSATGGYSATYNPTGRDPATVTVSKTGQISGSAVIMRFVKESNAVRSKALWTALDADNASIYGDDGSMIGYMFDSWVWDEAKFAKAEQQMKWDVALNGTVEDIRDFEHISQRQLIQRWVRAKANGGYADGGSGVTGTTIDQWTTHNALLPGGRNPGDMSLTVEYANTLSSNYHKIYSGDWESSIAMDRMGLAYGYWGEAAMMSAVYGASAMGMLYPNGGDSGYLRDYKDAEVAAGNRGGERYSPINLGPLDESIAATFSGASYSRGVSDGSLRLYRAYGGTARELGGYWTTSKPSGPYQSMIDNAVNPSWGNTFTNVSEIVVPAGYEYYYGYSASQGKLVGGGQQVFIEGVQSSWLVK